MTSERAKEIVEEFKTCELYSVTHQQNGLLVTEKGGRTSFFTQETNFFRWVGQLTESTWMKPSLQ